ncbi:MAG TPA: ABC transporter permease [Thermoflexia bacterium]|jgi:ABC-type dipeptide/oligopeptide/nickel transport system permease component|nr:ABC transporter permease [Thermoflexia bacterium]
MGVGYVGRRLLSAVFVLWLAASLAFFALKLTPGDPAEALLAASGATPEEVAERRAQLGLDDPLWLQYVRYLTDLARGDLGQSWLHGRPVGRMVLEQLGPTVELAVAATGVGMALGIGLGTLAAVRRRTWVDTAATAVAVVGLSTPTYWSGLLAILFFSLHLRWFPATGEGGLRHLVLPAAVLGFALAGSIARLVRARVAEVLGSPFVLAARARGLPGRHVLFVHVLKAAAGPALAVTALQFGFLLGGAVVTETVFARRGLGRLAVEAILWRDLPVVRGVVLVGALAYVGVNLLADLLHAWLDPRLREGAS